MRRITEKAVFDLKALYQLGYGLYVLTAKDGEKDNGCIVNTVMQVASNPLLVAVGVNKQNYTCGLVQQTGMLNVNSLTVDTPFEVFRHFGYQSGRNVDKFAGETPARSSNGLVILTEHTGGFLSLSVKQEMDVGSHVLFLCEPTEGYLQPGAETVTYAYYQQQIKPKPESTAKKKGFVCTVCGHIYEGDNLPANYICPICKHGAADFVPV